MQNIMNIQGFQKLTLLDFPGRTACTIFTGGCNLRCPFCHNTPLVIDPPKISAYSVEEILSFLDKRKSVLDGLAITGGEPLMQPDIEQFIIQVKEKGFGVKLDTNGTYPEKLKKLVEQGLVDYVAMDVKSCKTKYSQCVGIGGYNLSKIEESVEFLKLGKVDYEFRTTVAKELHNVEDFEELGQWIQGAKRHFIQAFKDSGELLGFGLSSVSKEDMLKMRDIMRKYVDECEVRGV